MIGLSCLPTEKACPAPRRFFTRHPYIKASFQGALFGSLLTMLVNDSGVVASTLLFYPVMSLLYCLKPEKRLIKKLKTANNSKWRGEG